MRFSCVQTLSSLTSLTPTGNQSELNFSRCERIKILGEIWQFSIKIVQGNTDWFYINLLERIGYFYYH